MLSINCLGDGPVNTTQQPSNQVAITLLDEETSRNAFRDTFLALYGISEPVIPLNRISQWEALVKQLHLEHLPVNDQGSAIFGGYFYNFTTPVPTQAEIETALDVGKRTGSTQFLVPTVRQSSDALILESYGFLRIPAMTNAIFDIETSVDRDYSNRIGKKQFKAIMKVVEAGRQEYVVEYYDEQSIAADPSLLNTLAKLHAYNTEKYKHPINFYNETVLKTIKDSTLGAHLLLVMRRAKEEAEPVQGMVCFQDRGRGHLYCMAQGTDSSRVKENQNLYLSSIYELYRYAEAQGFSKVHIGRGVPKFKQERLGVNRFDILDHWVKSSCPDMITTISEAAHRLMEQQLKTFRK
jgi:hypothetical protein